jgi:glycosyltransferase involved in cell wall biosynthesis
MEATVYFPTYKNGGSVFKLLKSLEKQTHRNFTVLVCYRKSDSDAVLGKLEAYRGLSLDIRFQRTRYWAECMNLALSKAEGEVTLSTDDDAIVSPDWVEKHVEMHRKHKNVGVITGAAPEGEGEIPELIPRLLSSHQWRINDYRAFDRPIDRRMAGYGMYVGRSGMLVDTGRSYNMIKTMKQHGVNMSWKSEMTEGFQIPTYCRMSFHSESAIALELLNRGHDSIYTDDIKIRHEFRVSSSRNHGATAMPEWIMGESVMFAYFTSRYYDIDLRVLRARTLIADAVSRVMSKSRGYEIGYGLVRRAIEEGWKPQQMLKASEKAIAYNL